MIPKIVLISFYNPNCQLFAHFYIASSHFLAFSSLIKKIFLQNASIFGILNNCELQIREIQGRELQGLPVVHFLCEPFPKLPSKALEIVNFSRFSQYFTYSQKVD